MDACMWAILTKDELRFIYNSLNAKLKGISLFDLIHPEENYLAKKDLCQFIKSKLLAGSVTKCRVKDYTQKHIHYASWIVVDIIMYVATEDLVLAFFHQEKGAACGMIHSDIKHDLVQSFQSCFLPNKPQQRVFYILDNQTKSIIRSWPSDYPNEILDDRPISPGVVSCFRCVQQQPFKTKQKGLLVQSLYIDYGSISFSISVVENKKSDIYRPPNKITHQPRYSRTPFIEDVRPEEHRSYKCQSCGTQSSPEWRRGPSGHKTLCNACGLRYSRLMARQEKLAQQKTMFPPMSPQPSPSASSTFIELPPFLCKYSPY
ncbi:hypothetical protein BY458DRAFT_512770 [Sporodiniella umbellata]|nr:hypothetical protein BY458DRAFT_512770 [Sporodiniella umbellata]